MLTSLIIPRYTSYPNVSECVEVKLPGTYYKINQVNIFFEHIQNLDLHWKQTESLPGFMRICERF
jgi:hypothetical protein